MRFTNHIILSLLVSTPAFGRIELPRFAAKQALENIRFISKDGRFTYTQKRSGALTLSSSFKSLDVLENAPGTTYYITASSARKKMVVEVDKHWNQEMDLTKQRDILIGTFNGSQFSFVGKGQAPRLHLDDEWLTWVDLKEKVIHIQFLRTKDRHYVIRLGRKHNPFFISEVVMLNPETILYTDVNDKGISALLSWNIVDQKMTVIRKADVSGTRMELCRKGNYVALGEFSYEDTNRGSGIQVMAWKDSPNLSGFTSLYRVSDNDIGQIICGEGKIWFVKTMSEDRKLNSRQTEAVSMELSTGKITLASELERVTNIVEMDGRILIPFRENIYVLEGPAGSSTETLRTPEKPAAVPRRTTP